MASVRCVAGSGCIEVGVQRVLPRAYGPAQASDFGEGTRWLALNETSGQTSAVGRCDLVEDVSHVLGAVVGNFATTCVPHLP